MRSKVKLVAFLTLALMVPMFGIQIVSAAYDEPVGGSIYKTKSFSSSSSDATIQGNVYYTSLSNGNYRLDKVIVTKAYAKCPYPYVDVLMINMDVDIFVTKSGSNLMSMYTKRYTSYFTNSITKYYCHTAYPGTSASGFTIEIHSASSGWWYTSVCGANVYYVFFGSPAIAVVSI